MAEDMEGMLERVVWDSYIEASIRALPRAAPSSSSSSSLLLTPPLRLDESHFTVETASSRYTIKNTTLRHLTIFPWLQKKEKGTHKEVLKPPNTLERVLEALNYFLSETYTDRDVHFLTEYYQSLPPPFKNPLTKIIEVEQEFKKQRLVAELEGLPTPPLHPSLTLVLFRFEINSN